MAKILTADECAEIEYDIINTCNPFITTDCAGSLLATIAAYRPVVEAARVVSDGGIIPFEEDFASLEEAVARLREAENA